MGGHVRQFAEQPSTHQACQGRWFHQSEERTKTCIACFRSPLSYNLYFVQSGFISKLLICSRFNNITSDVNMFGFQMKMVK